MTTLYISIPAVAPEQRHALEDRLCAAVPGIASVGGGTGMGESDIDLATDLTDPDQVASKIVEVWKWLEADGTRVLGVQARIAHYDD